MDYDPVSGDYKRREGTEILYDERSHEIDAKAVGEEIFKESIKQFLKSIKDKKFDFPGSAGPHKGAPIDK